MSEQWEYRAYWAGRHLKRSRATTVLAEAVEQRDIWRRVYREAFGQDAPDDIIGIYRARPQDWQPYDPEADQ